MKMESDSDFCFTDANYNVPLKVGTVRRHWTAMAHSILAGNWGNPAKNKIICWKVVFSGEKLSAFC